MQPSKSPMKILYLAGAGRSGGTLLGRILGQVPGYFAVGELHDTWARNFLRPGHCACHRPFGECEFWSAVFDKAFGGVDKVDPVALANARSHFRFSQDPRLLLTKNGIRDDPRFAQYFPQLEQLYHSIQEQSGCQVVVETSRVASYGLALAQLPGLDLHVLHLVRDLRGVALSWTRTKEWLQQRGLLGIALEWWASNLLTEMVFRPRGIKYKRLRYERFLADPAEALAEVGDWMEVPVPAPFAEDGRTASIRAYHGVVGNPDAFKMGDVQVFERDAWHKQLRPWTARWLWWIAAPLLRRYGY